MRKLALASLSISMFLLFGFSAFAQYADLNIGLTSARSTAVGGEHVAVTGDLSTLFHNPAGFASAPTQLSLTELTVRMTGPIFDISSVVIQGLDQDITDLLGSSQLQNLLRSIYARAEIVGPVYFGYIGNNLGFGFFNSTDVTFETSGPLALKAVAGEQFTLAGGYALRLLPVESDHALDLGILLKGVLRGEIEIEKSFLELPTLFSGGIGVDTALEAPFYYSAGMGLDLGVRYSFSDVFAFGLVGKDVFTPVLTQSFTTLNGFIESSEEPIATNDSMPINLTAGILFSPRLGQLERFINEINIMLDYTDILDFLTHPATASNPLIHISLGLEFTFLQVLSFRGGFNQGLFAAGLGLDLSIFRLHIAMFGSELSTEPGLRPAYNAQIGMEFSSSN